MENPNPTTSDSPKQRASCQSEVQAGSLAAKDGASENTRTPKEEGKREMTAETVAERTRSQTKKTVSLDLEFEKLTLESTPGGGDGKSGKTTPARPNSAKIRSHRLMFQSELESPIE